MTSNSAELDDACITEIEEDFDSFAVDPTRYASLRRFSCGQREHRSEREVNQMVREYASGKRKRKDGAFRVTVARHELVGVAAFQTATASQPGPAGAAPADSTTIARPSATEIPARPGPGMPAASPSGNKSIRQ